jgi:UDP-N-acetylmuramoyl-L-alanyl-D-glutamate--2,6-diaminopimelate ligase
MVGNAQAEVAGLAYDSRRVEPGFAFICVRGEKVDGHDFAAGALAQGATALVVEEGREAGVTCPTEGAVGIVPDSRAAMAIIARTFYDHPSNELTLAGVTGTNGKTTTALIIDAAFRRAGYSSGLLGTVEYRIGGQRLKAKHTTPEAVDLQGLLADMVAEGATHAAMEVSSHALALHRVDGCEFSAAVFTNLTPEHLDFHADMDEYLSTKRRLFVDPEFFPAGRPRVNAINIDDEAGREIARAARGETLTFALEREADCRAEALQSDAAGSRFTARWPGGAQEVSMRLVGRFNVYNAMGALAACVGLGVEGAAVVEALSALEPVRGRFERVPGRARTVLVDYAHTPDGLETALSTAKPLTNGKLIVVFGCGGDRDKTKRPVMGEIASRIADRCVVTSDNPRSERPEQIIREILAGIAKENEGRCVVEPDRASAIRLAIVEAGPEDLVLIAGKGHEDYQIFADRTIHFDDREVALQVLGELEGRPDA